MTIPFTAIKIAVILFMGPFTHDDIICDRTSSEYFCILQKEKRSVYTTPLITFFMSPNQKDIKYYFSYALLLAKKKNLH